MPNFYKSIWNIGILGTKLLNIQLPKYRIRDGGNIHGSVYISAISDPIFRQLDIKQLRSENPNVPNRFIEIWYFESKIQISKSLMICFLDPNLEKKVFRSKLPIAKMLKFSDFGSFAVSLLFFRKQGASTNCQNAKFGSFCEQNRCNR